MRHRTIEIAEANYVDIHRPRGNPKGNPQNFTKGGRKKKVGNLTREPSQEEVAAARKQAYEHVADTVSGLIYEVGCSVKHIGRLLHREMTRTVAQILAEKDTTIGTLSDIAAATGRRLEIRFVEEEKVQAKAA